MKKPAWMGIVFLVFLAVPVLAVLSLMLGIAAPIIILGVAIAFAIGMVGTWLSRKN